MVMEESSGPGHKFPYMVVDESSSFYGLATMLAKKFIKYFRTYEV